jgi:hypothetical protein
MSVINRQYLELKLDDVSSHEKEYPLLSLGEHAQEAFKIIPVAKE